MKVYISIPPDPPPSDTPLQTGDTPLETEQDKDQVEETGGEETSATGGEGVSATGGKEVEKKLSRKEMKKLKKKVNQRAIGGRWLASLKRLYYPPLPSRRS